MGLMKKRTVLDRKLVLKVKTHEVGLWTLAAAKCIHDHLPLQRVLGPSLHLIIG